MLRKLIELSANERKKKDGTRTVVFEPIKYRREQRALLKTKKKFLLRGSTKTKEGEDQPGGLKHRNAVPK